MLRRGWIVCLSFLIVFAVGLPPDSAEAATRAGYIVHKKGSAQQVTILRSGRTLSAKAGMLLYGGDAIRVRGSSNYVTVKIGGSGGRKKITASGSPFRIPTPSQSGFSSYWSSVWSNLGAAFGMTDRRTSSGTYTRGDGAEGGTAEPLTGLGVFDTRVLYASSDFDILAMRWCGDAQGVQIKVGSIASPNAKYGIPEYGSVEISEYAFPEDYGAPLPTEILITAAASGTENLEYKLNWVSLANIPRPEELADKPELTLEEKAMWGHWILANESGELGAAYNLIAFSLLNEAKSEQWEAEYEMERFSYCPGGAGREQNAALEAEPQT